MSKRVFKKKWLYIFSIIFLPITTLMLFSGLIGSFSIGFNLFEFSYLLLMAVFSLISCIKLFEKERKIVKVITIFLILLLLYSMYNAISLFPTHYVYEPENFIFSVLIIVYLILINKFKVSFEEFDEIEEIGNKE